MANEKISQLPAGGTAQPTDLIPLARSGGNISLPVSAVNQVIASSPDGSVSVGGSGTNTLALAIAAAFQGAFNVLPGKYTYAGLPSAAANANLYAATNDGTGPVYSNGVYWEILFNQTQGVIAISIGSPLAPAAQSVAYTLPLTATGAIGTLTWSLVSKYGATNNWVITPGTTNLTGTPATVTTDTLTIQVSDQTGAFAQKTVTVQTVASLSPAATPTFSPIAGTYTGTQNVTISCSTPSSTIYYTTNGSTPTTGSTVYTTPVVVAASATLQAIATAAGFTQSAVGSAAYTISASGGHYVGANGTDINYYTPEFPFLDILRQAGNNNGYWATVLGASSLTDTNEEAYLQLDANGQLTSIAPLAGHTATYDRVFTFINRSVVTLANSPTQASYYPAGAYILTIAGGTGVITFGGDVSTLSSPSTGITIAGLTLTSTLASGVSGTVNVNVNTPGEGGMYLYLSATDTGATGNYLKLGSLVYSPWQSQYLSGNIFSPTFKAALTGFSCWRCMKWLQVENDDLWLTFNAQLNNGNNTGGTLTNIAFTGGGSYGANWPFKTGTRNVAFANGQIISCGFTSGSPTVTWSTALTANIPTTPLVVGGVMAITPKTQGWAGLNPATSLNWGKQVPYEVCLQLGNEMNIDIWVNLPCVAYFTDTTMGTNLAQLAFNGTGTTLPGFTGLKSTQKVYVEYANEVWNFNYPCTRFAYSMGGVYIPGQANASFASQQWYGTQVGKIAAAFSTVYGGAFAARAIVTMGTQFAQLSTLLPQAMNAADWVSQGGGKVAPYTQGVGGYHSAPYCVGVFPIKNTDLVAINALGDPKSAIFGLLYTDVYSTVTYPSIQSAGIIGANAAYIAGQLAGISGQPWHTLPHFGYESGDSLCFNAPLNSGDGLVGVAITGTAGQFSCTAGKNLTVGMQLTISGTFGGTGSITGYANSTTYQVSVTNGSTTFTLQTLASGAIVTTAGTPTGLTYTCLLSAAQTTTITAWLLALSRDPRMAKFYYDPNSTLGGTGYLPAMYLYYKFINHFQLINPNSYGNSTWGALENVGQTINPLSSAPSKYQGLENFIGSSPATVATIDSANVASLTSSGTGPQGFNVTCATTDNFLLVFVGLDSSGGVPPTGITYNGVALTQIGNISRVSNMSGNVSAWYLNTPTTGSALSLSVAWTGGSTGIGICAIPMSGVGISIAPTFASGAATTAAGAVSVTGAGSNDMQVAACFIRSTSLVSAGAPQTHVITPVNGINGLDGFAVDSIVGASAGNFAWTLTSGDWIALGVTVFG